MIAARRSPYRDAVADDTVVGTVAGLRSRPLMR